MKKPLNIAWIGLFTFLVACQETPKPPNIIYILADDLGYGELGVYGQKWIETPNLDALAANGMRFIRHYSGAPVCAPARCVLLTGQHSGHAFVRGNDEWGERGRVWDYQAMYDDPSLEGQRPLPDSIVTVAELLQKQGYQTGMVGKWGLGAPNTEGLPNRQGFDFFYGYNCQRQAHTYYPMHLWKNEERVLLDNKFVDLHINLAPEADSLDPASYAAFSLKEYAPTLMHQEALGFLERHQDEPFFLYYASPIPHVPLQAPQRWVDHYREKLGPEEPYVRGSYYPNRYPKATYAAMISYLDEQVGELVAKLKEVGQYENTLIIFSSDNGPTYTGGAATEFFESAAPFRTDPGWGKGFTHEGGIRVPMIASWPDKIAPGSVSPHISAFYDVLPTLCEVAGYKGPLESDGISFLPALLGQTQTTHPFLYWEFPSYQGQQAVRMGRWKGIRKNIFKGNMEIELYDLETDSLESTDLAAQHPEIVKQIAGIMSQARTEPALDRFKIEALGDVKASYLEAVKRAQQLQPPPQQLQLGEGYFSLSSSTRVSNLQDAPEALAVLQNRLQKTGGYLLRAAREKDTTNLLAFVRSSSIPAQEYQLRITREQLTISAGGGQGFALAIQRLLQLMDPKIMVDKEMARPSWTIAALELVEAADQAKG
jgi:arylsulfatase A-like enzyme